MGFRFIKCPRRRALPVTKATGSQATVLNRLRAFLDTEEPQTVQWLVGVWGDQQAAISYWELREIALNGWVPDNRLELWRRDYAEFVNTRLIPQWERAMAAAAEEKLKQFPYFLYDPSVGSAQAYIRNHGAELVVELVNSQRDSIQAMVAKAAHFEAMTADNLSRIIRPVIGLTTPQSIANLNYWNSIWESGVEAGLSSKVALERANRMAATYAERQHRYRAFNIARTELASAYNEGGYGAIIDAQSQGYIGDCKKTWITADDERVCPLCGVMDGESVNMNAFFSNGVKLPPAHPQCRCAVAYEEVSENLLTNDSTRGIINTNEGDNMDVTEANMAESREMASGLRRSPGHILTDEEIEILKKDIEALQADISVFKFNKGRRTSYIDESDEVRVKGDVFPDTNSIHPRDLMSSRAVLAHEYYGHRPYRNLSAPLPYGSWNDEFRASYMAAQNAPGLSNEDRRYLILDALERAKTAGVSITYNSFIRRILYDY